MYLYVPLESPPSQPLHFSELPCSSSGFWAAMGIGAKLLVFFVVALLVILMAESNSMVWANKLNNDADQYLLSNNKANYGQGSLRSYQCPSQCNRRCSQTQYKKPCLFFCNKCCSKCLCVPPGYYGNKGICPCYNNWKTKRGGPKCP